MDSNLLVVVFVGLWSPAQVGRRVTGDEYHERDFNYLAGLIASARPWIVTPHLLTEADDRLDRMNEPGASECRKLIAGVLATASERRSRSIKVVSETGYSRLGLADSAIIRAARKHDCVVLTSDEELYIELLRSGHEAYYYPAIQQSLLSSER